MRGKLTSLIALLLLFISIPTVYSEQEECHYNVDLGTCVGGGYCPENQECRATGPEHCECINPHICYYDYIDEECNYDAVCMEGLECVETEPQHCECIDEEACRWVWQLGNCSGECPVNLSCEQTGPESCGCFGPQQCHYHYPLNKCVGECPADLNCNETSPGICECEGECPLGCACLTEEEAIELSLMGEVAFLPCQGTEILCGITHDGTNRYCFEEVPIEECPEDCVCLFKEEGEEQGLPLCHGEEIVCEVSLLGALLCFEKPIIEECPSGCECLTREEALDLNLTLCQGEETVCGETPEGIPLLCFELPPEGPPEAVCPPECECLTEEEAEELGFVPCHGMELFCGQTPDGINKYCFEEAFVEECPEECICMEGEGASLLNLSLCHAEEIICDVVDGIPLLCFEVALTDEMTEKAMLAYNQNIEKVPGIIKALFGNERLNIHINSMIIGVVTKDARIEEMKEGEIENPTMNVYVSKKVISDILKSDDPVSALLTALEKGDIKYEGVSIESRVKFFFVDIGVKILSLFKGFFG